MPSPIKRLLLGDPLSPKKGAHDAQAHSTDPEAPTDIQE